MVAETSDIELVELVLLCALVRVYLGMGLFSQKLPKKPAFWPKLGLATLALVLHFALMVAACLVAAPEGPSAGYVFQAVFFSLLQPLLIYGLMYLYDISVWTASFCATAGYTIQNLASGAMELVSSLAATMGAAPATISFHLVVNFICIPLTYVPCYLLFSRRLEQRGLETVENHGMLAMMPVVCLVIIGFDVLIKCLAADGIAPCYFVALRLLHGLLCVALLWVEYQMLYRTHLEQEQATTERLLAEHDRQLRLSRENVEAINIKCHDLRHQIRSLAQGGAVVSGEALADLAHDISIYDSSVKTGNEALDTILTEKRLLCESRKITLTCVADGGALAFMAAADIYALFGNALDNAIEAVTTLDDQAKRSITLVVRQVMGCAKRPRGELLRRGARVRGRNAADQQGRPRIARLWRQVHAADGRALRRHLLRQRRRWNLPTGHHDSAPIGASPRLVPQGSSAVAIANVDTNFVLYVSLWLVPE